MDAEAPTPTRPAVRRRPGPRGRWTPLSLAVPAALLLLAAVTAPAGAQQRSLLIERFDATIRVEESGWIDVREQIQVRFTGSWNGIFRDIPVQYRTPQGFSYKLFLTDVRVLGEDGQPLETDESREGQYRRLRIRVPGAENATRTVNIHYRVPNALRFHEELDELYWNVTGDEWQMPIRTASAMVLLPDGVEHTRTASWTGGYGSAENVAQVEETGDGLFFETLQPLDFREGLTVAVGWDPGVVERPGAAQKAWLFLLGNWPLFFPLISAVLMWRIWRARGKDPARRSVAPQYAPPRGLRPAQVGTLVDNRPDMRDITAVLVDLAVRGYLRIEEVEKGGLAGFLGGDDYRLVPVRPRESWQELEPHERTVLEGVFSTSALDSDGIPVATRISELKHEFYSELPAIKDRIFDSLLARGFYEKRPDKVTGRWVAAGGVVMALGVVGGIIVSEQLAVSPLVALLSGIFTGIPVMAFGVFMPARTVDGTRALEEVLGFEEFLERVESERYRRMIQGPEMFEQYLPYAMAFGVAERWARAFEDICTEPPRWYGGRWDGGFHSVHFAHSLGSMSSAASTAMSTGPRSSGGSGFGGGGGFSGGGFSGGGFGGGGGGGW